MVPQNVKKTLNFLIIKNSYNINFTLLLNEMPTIDINNNKFYNW